MNTKKLYLKRNITKKSYSYFKKNINKYLTPSEENKIICKNNLHTSKYPNPSIHFKSSITINKQTIQPFIKKILKHYLNKEYN
jgi:hypothetical protein